MTRRRRGPPKWLEAARRGVRPGDEGADWIARALARAGVMPTAEAEAAVKAGRVKVDGRTVHEPFALVRQGDEVRVDGQKVSLATRTRCLMLHKPAGVVTAASDPEGQGTVFERLLMVLPPGLSRYGWHAVGRLDRDTTGLLLFTNDEKLVAHATLPGKEIPKRYVAVVGSVPTDEKLAPLRKGITLDDGPTKPARARVVGEREVELTLTEGRRHQVKRMLGAVGLPVLRLHRAAIGSLQLDVAEGQVRELGTDEIREALGFEPRNL